VITPSPKGDGFSYKLNPCFRSALRTKARSEPRCDPNKHLARYVSQQGISQIPPPAKAGGPLRRF